MSPAQDVYALAVTLLRTTTGLRPPGQGGEMPLAALLDATSLPPDWRALLRAMLHPDPALRLAEASRAADAIRALTEHGVEAAPTSTVLEQPVVPAAPAAMPTPPRRARYPGRWIALGAVLLAASLALVVFRGRGREEPIREACRVLAGELVARQRPDGGFSGIRHVAPSGWDTAQQLFALEASRSCGADVDAAVGRARARLAEMRGPSGWSGDGPPLAVANAWAVLAEVEGALPALLALQNDDGGFAWSPDAPSHAYATAMALLALPSGDAAERAAAWLSREPVVTETPGLDELGWVAAQRHGAAPGDGDALRARMDARCGGPDCSAARDGELPWREGANVHLQWLPWAALASARLGDDARVAQLMERLAATDPGLPSYVIAERVLALAELTSR